MSYMGPENGILDMQDENEELRKTLRDLRITIKNISADLSQANRQNLEELLADSAETLEKSLQTIDSVL